MAGGLVVDSLNPESDVTFHHLRRGVDVGHQLVIVIDNAVALRSPEDVESRSDSL